MRSGPRWEKLSQIDREIEEGKLGIARDRLQGLLKTYPADLTLRNKLGDVYLRLGYPIEAGRFWFLLSDPDERQQEAITAFLHSCGFQPEIILKRSRVPGVQHEGASLDDIRQAIREHLLSLEGELAKKNLAQIEELHSPRWFPSTELGIFGCLLAAIFIFLAVVHFIITILTGNF